jgi:hypothetical protein
MGSKAALHDQIVELHKKELMKVSAEAFNLGYKHGTNNGQQLEQERALQLLNGLTFRWDGDKQSLLIDKRELVALFTEK